MEPTYDDYPVFEANQVLTSGHLNDLFNYLDEQERLTRANLVGIGIVCGLEVVVGTGANPVIHLSKGSGNTSEGYLIVEQEDVDLVAYRSYQLPPDLAYPTLFKDTAKNEPYAMWELFTAGEPATTPLDAAFLNDKAMVLFLELNKQPLRNCSPNNCDDKGADVTATVRRLLIQRSDLDAIIASSHGLSAGLTASDLDNALQQRLNLSDLRLPRFDVPSSTLATTNDVLAAFLNVFRAGKMAAQTGKALSAAYAAFQPVLQDDYQSDPFANFGANFGFLDTSPSTADQVRFLQYYYDLFGDLICAYDEFRWKGAELVCACCPDDALFPRHLMLGALNPPAGVSAGMYRQAFMASPAVSRCAEDVKELKQLFRRLVEMVAQFTNTPPLPKSDIKSTLDLQIRVTPSVLGDVPLSARAIPYYYRENGTPPLYQIWNPEKARRHRANQNLSYRSDEYSPPAPAFVTTPLGYDLLPYDFLRVEGHLGKDYQHVMTTLLTLKEQYRLPIEVIALRSGAYDENMPVDLSKENCRFEDLEALFEALREELLSTLCEGIGYFYDLPVADSKLAGGQPKLPLLQEYAPNYNYPAASVGAWYEAHLAGLQSRPYIDVDQNNIDKNAVITVYCQLFAGTDAPPAANQPEVVCVYYLSKLAEIVPEKIDALAYADFENKYQDLMALVRYFRSDEKNSISADFKQFIPQDDLIDHFDEVLFSCKLDPIRATHDEYLRRLGEVRKRQFFSQFLQDNPGIQHRAGVPLGGTFIIVYHQNPAPASAAPANPAVSNFGGFRIARVNPLASNTAAANPGVIRSGVANLAAARPAIASPAMAPRAGTPNPAPSIRAPALPSSPVNTAAAMPVGASPQLSNAISRITSNYALASNADVQNLINSIGGHLGGIATFPVSSPTDEASGIISDTVDGLADGTVVADFYLPYLCTSACAGIRFELPKILPAFTAQAGCTDAASKQAQVTLTPRGGTQPYGVSIDGQSYAPLSGPVMLGQGVHTLKIMDAEGVESDQKTITVAAPLAIGNPVYQCSPDFTTFKATVQISGGTPPYVIQGTTVAGTGYTTDVIKSGDKVTVAVEDSNQCSASVDLTYTCVKPCDLPCSGIAQRRGYRFWLPEPDKAYPYNSFNVEQLGFTFQLMQGAAPVDLSADIKNIVNAAPADLNNKFGDVVKNWLDGINKLISAKAGRNDWLVLSYDPPPAGGLGTLWIEHFSCLDFNMTVTSNFNLGDYADQSMLAYAVPGTSIRSKRYGDNVQVPAFDGTGIDKCKNTAPQPLCPKTPDCKLAVAPTSVQHGQEATFTVSASGNDVPAAYLWEVLKTIGGVEYMLNGTQLKFNFGTPGSYPVRVTAFMKDGCRVTSDLIINVT